MPPIRSETELYKPLKGYFENQGYAVKGEVSGCDLVAVREGEEPLIVEMKRAFNLPLVFQGINRLRWSPRVYVAVEWRKRAAASARWKDVQRLCRLLGLGLIAVTFYSRKAPFVEVLLHPGAAASPKTSRVGRERLVREFRERSGDYNVGGSTGVKLITAYREKAIACAKRLSEQGPLSPKQLRELTGTAKAASILQQNVYGWFHRLERGKYTITDTGRQALLEYAERIPSDGL